MSKTSITLKKQANADCSTVAFCGTRGLPANYGGFETAVDHITADFVDRGVDCEVFCRRSNGSEPRTKFEGRKLIYVDGSRHRTLDTFVASLQSGRIIWRNRRRYACVLWFNNANLPGILITALARVPMVINTDGLEWRRAKWSWPFKLYYYLSSWLVSRLNASLVSDSRGIQEFYRREFDVATHFIPYGAPRKRNLTRTQQEGILARYGLKQGRYFLQITRPEPDNLPLEAAESFAASGLAKSGYQMVIIGYQQSTPYADRLKKLDGEGGIRVLPANYDSGELYALRRNCHAYIHGNSVGGTNPALLEAMAVCPRVLAIDINFSREVLGESGRFFTVENLHRVMQSSVAGMPDCSADMQHRIEEQYRWDEVARSYRRLVHGHSADYRTRAESEEISAVATDSVKQTLSAEKGSGVGSSTEDNS